MCEGARGRRSVQETQRSQLTALTDSANAAATRDTRGSLDEAGAGWRDADFLTCPPCRIGGPVLAPCAPPRHPRRRALRWRSR